MRFVSWECPEPRQTPSHSKFDKEAVQYETALAEQILTADLLAPFLRLAYISPIYLTHDPSSLRKVHTSAARIFSQHLNSPSTQSALSQREREKKKAYRD